MSCDNCEQCKGCSLVPGLKKALKILDYREEHAIGANYDRVFLAAFKELRVFLNAEVWRQENPEEAEKSRTVTGNFL